MKYLILIYGNPENWEHPMFLRNPEFLALPEAERAVLVSRAEEMHREIRESGELVVGAALADPVQSRTIQGSDGVPTMTDGPYVEAKEQLAGFFVVDCETRDRAVEIAASFLDALVSAVEVRPIMDMAGQEM